MTSKHFEPSEIVASCDCGSARCLAIVERGGPRLLRETGSSNNSRVVGMTPLDWVRLRRQGFKVSLKATELAEHHTNGGAGRYKAARPEALDAAVRDYLASARAYGELNRCAVAHGVSISSLHTRLHSKRQRRAAA